MNNPPGFYSIITVCPPGAPTKLELCSAMVVSLLLQAQVPVLDHCLLDSTN